MPARVDGYVERYLSFDSALPQAGEAKTTAHLTPAERAELDRLRDTGRRTAWLHARWLGKHLIRLALAAPDTPLVSIEICSRDERGRAVRPVVKVDGDRLPVCLSISHSARGVLVALATDPEVTIGVDLAVETEAKPGFLETWFTPGERRWLNGNASRDVTTCWAIKEAVYKACNAGEPFAPRNIQVFRSSSGVYWSCYRETDLSDVCEIRVRDIDGQIAVTAVMRDSARCQADAAFEDGGSTIEDGEWNIENAKRLPSSTLHSPSSLT